MTPGTSRSTEDALVARRVTKAFSGAVALSELDLTIARGEIHGFVGENGSGKSTFIKILSGFHTPEPESEVTIAGRPLTFGSPHASLELGCRFIHQDLGLVSSSSVLDNLFLTSGFPHRAGVLNLRSARREAREALARVGLELDLSRPVASLAPAERTGVAMARALRSSGGGPVRLLVLDEPTATLPDSEVNRLLGIVGSVAESGVGVLYVSHRLDEILSLTSRVTVLRDGYRIATEPTSTLDRRRLVELLVGSEIDDTRAAADTLQPDSGEVVLGVRDVVAPTVASVSFTCRAGEILGIAGITGSGRDALLGALFGALPRFGGSVTVDGRTVPAERPAKAVAQGIAYLPPDRSAQGGFMDMKAHENLSIVDLAPLWGRVDWRRGRQIAESQIWFRRLQISPQTGDKHSLRTFSGGNQQKVLLAKWLRIKPRVLLLDEPTQGVDIGARAVIHSELIAAARGGAAVVCSSTDVDELAALCQRVLVLNAGHISTILEGSQVTVGNITRACLVEAPELVP